MEKRCKRIADNEQVRSLSLKRVNTLYPAFCCFREVVLPSPWYLWVSLRLIRLRSRTPLPPSQNPCIPALAAVSLPQCEHSALSVIFCSCEQKPQIIRFPRTMSWSSSLLAWWQTSHGNALPLVARRGKRLDPSNLNEKNLPARKSKPSIRL